MWSVENSMGGCIEKNIYISVYFDEVVRVGLTYSTEKLVLFMQTSPWSAQMNVWLTIRFRIAKHYWAVYIWRSSHWFLVVAFCVIKRYTTGQFKHIIETDITCHGTIPTWPSASDIVLRVPLIKWVWLYMSHENKNRYRYKHQTSVCTMFVHSCV